MLRVIRTSVGVSTSRIAAVVPQMMIRYHGEVTLSQKDAPFLKVARYSNMDEYKTMTAPLQHYLSQTSLVPGQLIKFTKKQLVHLLDLEPGHELETALFVHADSVSTRFFGNKVFFRGLIEFSNQCDKDCYYCGLRSSMTTLDRFTMKREDIMDAAMFAMHNKYGSIMLQTKERLNFITDIIREIRKKTVAADPAAISLGELPRDYYAALKDAGAHRYLLRIESSNKELYSKIHPRDANHSWQSRYECLCTLRDLGYQLGTGCMVGLPHQTTTDLASDVLFFDKLGADMIGCGPYMPQSETPLGEVWNNIHKFSTENDKLMHYAKMFQLTTRLNALIRIHMGNVNIPATTALQACVATGREIAIRRGANVLMPILTKDDYRQYYQLYDNKPCVHDTRGQCMNCLTGRVKSVGKEVAWGVWGDPLHAFGAADAVPAPQQFEQPPCSTDAPAECGSCNIVSKFNATFRVE